MWGSLKVELNTVTFLYGGNKMKGLSFKRWVVWSSIAIVLICVGAIIGYTPDDGSISPAGALIVSPGIVILIVTIFKALFGRGTRDGGSFEERVADAVDMNRPCGVMQKVMDMAGIDVKVIPGKYHGQGFAQYSLDFSQDSDPYEVDRAVSLIKELRKLSQAGKLSAIRKTIAHTKKDRKRVTL